MMDVQLQYRPNLYKKCRYRQLAVRRQNAQSPKEGVSKQDVLRYHGISEMF